MIHRHFFIACWVLVWSSVSAQERSYMRPAELQRSTVMDRGDGRTLIAAQQTFGFDSTRLYLLSADQDHQLSTLGGARLQFPNAILNDAAHTPDGAIMVGAHMGFSTIPFVLRMDSLGQVMWCKTFPGLIDGQDQIAEVHVDGGRLDLFTFGSPDHSFYRLSGRLDGSFIQSQRIIAPPTLDHRVNATVPNGAEWGHLVISKAIAADGGQDLYVMVLDSAGIVWETAHDHGSGASPQFEEAQSVIRAANGDYIYTMAYAINNTTPVVGKLVRMNSSGSIIWSKEYRDGIDRTALSGPIETADGSLLLTASNIVDNSTLVLKLDPAGEVVQAKRYVQSVTTASPFGQLYNFDQGRLLAYRSTQFTELNENLVACDLQTITTVSAIDAMPAVLPTSLLTVVETLTVNDLTTESRSGEFSNELDCTHTGMDERFGPPTIRVFPVPANDRITLDLATVTGKVVLHVQDLHGRIVHSSTLLGGGKRNLDISMLARGVYQLYVVQGERIGQGRFVRE